MDTALWKLRREHGILEHLIEYPALLTTQRRVPGNLPPLQSLCSNFRLPQGWPGWFSFRPGWAPQVERLEIASESTLSCNTRGARFEGGKKSQTRNTLEVQKCLAQPVHIIKKITKRKKVCVFL